MKKSIFLFFAAILCAMSVQGANTMRIYCKNSQSWWKADGAAVGAYYWGTGGNANSWPGTRMTKVSGQTDLWYIDVDIDKYQNIIFTRVNGSGSVSDWGAKTNDLTIGNTKNQYTITQSSGAWNGAKSAGTWGTYKPTSTAALATSAENIFVGGQATLTPSLTSNASANTIKETAYAISPEGANVNGNTFTATAAGAYTVTATVTYYPLGCPTLTSTATATTTITAEVPAEETHDVTVSYMFGETKVAEPTIVNTVGVETSVKVTAPEIAKYTFANWTLGADVATTNALTSNEINIITKAGGSDFTLVANYEKAKLTYTVTVPAGTENCYIVGAMNGWDVENPIEMTKQGENVFTVTLEDVEKTDEYKYISQKGTWDYADVQEANRAWSANDVVTAWKDPLATNLYLRGGMNEWGTIDQFKKEAADAATAIVIVALKADTTYEFKVASADWSEGYSSTTAFTATSTQALSTDVQDNAKLTTVAAGDYTFTWNLTTKKLTVTYPELPKYQVTTTVNPAESGTVTGTGEYEQGKTAILTATATAGYKFVNWTENEVEVSTDAEYTFEVLADHNLVANFKKKTYTVTATATNGTVTGLVEGGIYEHGATATLTATPVFDYQFVNWSNGSTENPLTITVTDNVTLEANFAEVAATEKKESGVFSISAHKTATFATGNLQYNVGTQAWRFAKQQYQVVGEQNIQLGHPDFTGWIDMFGYSADGKFGVNPSNANADYAKEFVDWGTLFPEEGWSTLSKEDWKYLLEERTNAANLQQVAKVGDILGIMLFPDNWNLPEGCTPTEGTNHDPDDGEETKYDFTTQNYTLEQWTKLEAAGAVFLPAAGRRTGGWGNTTLSENVPGGELDAEGHYKHFDNCNEYAYYWTSTKVGENVNYLINCRLVDKPNNIYSVGAAHVDWAEKGRYGQSVRLAKVVYDKHTVNATAENGKVEGADADEYTHGTEITLTAIPAEHYVFVNWTAGETVLSTKNPYIFTLEKDVELTANFALDTHTITATAENGTVTGAGTYTHGTTATLTATANEHYVFVNWTKGEEVVAETAEYTFTVEADVELVANFKLDSHTIAATAENGTVTGVGIYEHGATVTLTATANEHYVFVNWTKGEEVVAETAEYTFTVEVDVELVANFKLDSHTVAATAENGSVTGAGIYEHGKEVTLTATADEGYEFVNWTVGEEVVAETAEYTFTVKEDVNLVANFQEVVPVITHTVKWYTAVGETTEVTLEDGATITKPATDPEMEGHVFMGWTNECFVAEDGSDFAAIEDFGTADADKEYYAVFAVETTTEGGATETLTGSSLSYAGNNGYVEFTATTTSGTWSGKACYNTNDYIQINKNRNNYHIGSPTFAANIKSIKITTTNSTASKRTFYICSSNSTAQPTSGDLGSHTTTASNEQFTIELTSDVKQFYIYSSGAVYISQIDVTVSGEPTTTYSNYMTTCTPEEYTIEWSVNGEVTETTTVVEGDALVLPEAPAAPDACSDKVFMGWATTATVNVDGSAIIWAIDTIIPESDNTYYAVFATEIKEETNETYTKIAIVSIADYATANSWADATKYENVVIDQNITATAISTGSNTGKYYANGNNWRLYQTDKDATLTIGAAEGVTIKSVSVTYTNTNGGVLTFNTSKITSGTTVEVNAPSITFGVGNTGTATNGQVRVTKIAVDYTFSGTITSTTYTDYSTICVIPEYTVTFEYSVDAGYITVNDNHISEKEVKYAEGTVLTVKALTFDNYRFDAWEDEDGNELSTEPTYTFTVTKDVVLKAIITPEQGAVGTSVENNNVVTSETMKVIQNGRLFIIREGKIYNAQGQVVK